jgi:flavin reductase (DIM6/NTAB) family NADH-FMN oxidoreductase RutF
MDAAALANLTGSLDYPMVVVTVATTRERSGCLVGFMTQCSLDPPRFCVYVSKANHTHHVAKRASHLMVHFLGREHHGIASHFGELTGDRVDKFAGVAWQPGPDGHTPVVTGVDTWVFGRIERRHDGGDHRGYILEPVAISCPRPFTQLGFQDVTDLDAAH